LIAQYGWVLFPQALPVRITTESSRSPSGATAKHRGKH